MAQLSRRSRREQVDPSLDQMSTDNMQQVMAYQRARLLQAA